MKFLKGHLLVAASSLESLFFTRSVILMCEHSAEGAMGLILNRPTEASVGDVAETVLNEPLDWEKPICLGGPVEGPLVVLHAEAEQADQTIVDGVHYTIDADKVRALLSQQTEPSRIIANYSGWGPGQLEGEMEEGSWLTWPAGADLVFGDGGEDLWTQVMQQIQSSDLARMIGVAHLPADPSAN